MTDSKERAWTASLAIYYLEFLPLVKRAAEPLGYAIAVHGSLTRDFDLVAVPWTEQAVSAQELAEAVCAAVRGYMPLVSMERPQPPGVKPHGRLVWIIVLAAGGFMDLSIMPRQASFYHAENSSRYLALAKRNLNRPAAQLLCPRCEQQRAIQDRDMSDHPGIFLCLGCGHQFTA